jgi:hypothetical protein
MGGHRDHRPRRHLLRAGGYASTVRLGSRWAVSSVAVVALLFAPATDDGPAASNPQAGQPNDPRILAPTVRDAFVGMRPKLAAPTRGGTDLGSLAEPSPLAVASAVAVAVVLPVWASFAVGLRSGKGSSLTFLRGLVPRGPPGLPTI